MLKLIQTEFLKLRRRKFIWLMLSAALFMPALALFYFNGEVNADPVKFYNWTALSYTPWIILPVVLGILSTMIMYDENQYDVLKQLWIIPVSKMGYFLGKFVVAESRKLRRSKIVWITVFATVMVAATVFAQGQFIFYGSRYIDGAGWYMTAAQSLATLYVLPAVIALLGSYMVCREEQEDTMKSLQLIPVNEAKLTAAKMIVSFGFSLLIYLLLFAMTLLVEAALHLDELPAGMVAGFFKTYLLDGAGVFFAISPIVAFVARIKKGYWLALVFTEIYSFAGLFAGMSDPLKTFYPITAVFNISGYYEAATGEVIGGLAVLLLCMCLSIIGLSRLRRANSLASTI